jgi:hypothetical protein
LACSLLSPCFLLLFPCSVVGWLLQLMLLLLLITSVALLFPCHLCCFLIHCWLVVASRATAPLRRLHCFRTPLPSPLLTSPFPAPPLAGCYVVCHSSSTLLLHAASTPLLPSPFPAPSLVGCCVMHCCSSSFALAYFPLATFAILHSVASWLLHPMPLLLLLLLLPLTSPLLSLPLPTLLLVGCYVAHCFSSSLHLRASPLLPLLIPSLHHPLICPGWL